MEKAIFCLSFAFFFLDQIPKIKICHMVASENTEVIEGRQRLICTDVLDLDETYEDVSIDDDGYASDEEDGSVSVEAVVSTGVTKL